MGRSSGGEGKPSLETLVDIANALGVTVDSLLSDILRRAVTILTEKLLQFCTP